MTENHGVGSSILPLGTIVFKGLGSNPETPVFVRVPPGYHQLHPFFASPGFDIAISSDVDP